MIFRGATIALGSAYLASAAPWKRLSPPSAYDWGQDKIRGVNLGGWLVLEPWITPSIFQSQLPGVVDEYTLCEALGQQTALDAWLRPHWDSWVQESDFQKIAQSGFNVVRIPIGYWAYDNSDSPYAAGAAPYMDQAIAWARQFGLKVIVDLHGAPGSQNGFDNSGQRTSTLLWQSGDNVQKTLDVLQTIQNKYACPSYDDVVAGIELINEPLTPDLNLDDVKQFERNGYGQQRMVSNSTTVVIQDGFQPVSSYNGWLTPQDPACIASATIPSDGCQNVAMDHHEYQVFTPELVSMSPADHRQYVCNNAGVYSGSDKWTFVGEWSAAMTDCATWLNGYGIGARYDGTYPDSWFVGSCEGVDSLDSWTQQLRDDTRCYIEAQMESFEDNTQGWLFWNFKTENSPEWDAFRLIDAGIFPQPLDDRRCGRICA